MVRLGPSQTGVGQVWQRKLRPLPFRRDGRYAFDVEVDFSEAPDEGCFVGVHPPALPPLGPGLRSRHMHPHDEGDSMGASFTLRVSRCGGSVIATLGLISGMLGLDVPAASAASAAMV